MFGTPANNPLTTLFAPSMKTFTTTQTEDLNLYDGGLQTVAQTGDVYVRGTNNNDLIQFGGSGNGALVKANAYSANYTVPGRTVAYARGGNDQINQNQYLHTALFFGEDGSDTLTGGPASDRLYGGGGNDTLQGYAGDDLLAGNDGVDNLYGSYGNDVLIGGAGSDNLAGNDGHDLVFKGSVSVTAPAAGTDNGVASYLNDLAMLALLFDWTSDLDLDETTYTTDDAQSND